MLDHCPIGEYCRLNHLQSYKLVFRSNHLLVWRKYEKWVKAEKGIACWLILFLCNLRVEVMSLMILSHRLWVQANSWIAHRCLSLTGEMLRLEQVILLPICCHIYELKICVLLHTISLKALREKGWYDWYRMEKYSRNIYLGITQLLLINIW